MDFWLEETQQYHAVAAGADGIMVEVHHDPPSALSEAEQALTPEMFAILAKRVRWLSMTMSKMDTQLSLSAEDDAELPLDAKNKGGDQ